MNKKRGFRPVTIVIEGKPVNVAIAKVIYRCEICCEKLTLTGNRLHCKDDNHRGMIHRDIAAARLTTQETNITNLPYKIVNGKVEYNGN